MNYFKFSPNNHTSSRDFMSFIQTISEWPLFTSDKCTYITLYTSHCILKTVRVEQLNYEKCVLYVFYFCNKNPFLRFFILGGNNISYINDTRYQLRTKP